MALIKCRECGEEISSTAEVCPHCGFKNKISVCPECGKPVSADDASCPECGCPLHKKSAAGVITENLDKLTGAKSETYVSRRPGYQPNEKQHWLHVLCPICREKGYIGGEAARRHAKTSPSAKCAISLTAKRILPTMRAARKCAARRTRLARRRATPAIRTAKAAMLC